MQYRNDKNGNPISLIGFGCMRLSKNGSSFDFEKAESEIMNAINAGVNYFDTAYVYKNNEALLGDILRKNNCREKVNIATKLPQFLVKSTSAFERYFQEELNRLKTDYIDFYLMHMINDVERWKQLKNMGILEWIEEKKASGQIRNIGFSYHGNTENFIPLIEAYPWDICMFQYNYLDEHTQAGRKGLEFAHKNGIPVVIMEPLRGGKLVNLLPREALELFEKEGKGRSPAEWGLRWLWQQPEITCVLSGMNSLDMVNENIRIASEVQENEFTESDYEFISKVAKAINSKIKVNCTACSYCMPCPHGVDIPLAFKCYNQIYTEDKKTALREYMQCTAFRKNSSAASACIKCGQCETHCPQHIEIRKELDNAKKNLEGPFYKAARFAVKHLKLWS